MKTEKRVGIYARCSTSDQSTDMQLNDLEQYSKERGFKIYRIYKDNGVSGTKESRPALNALMNDAKKRKFDVVLVWRFDRFARSTKHLISALYEFRNLGIDFISYQENIDTSSPLGEAIFTIISAMAKLERDIIAERVKGGLRRAQANGKRLGRPKSDVNTDKIVEYRKQKKSIRQIARELNLTNNLVFRTLQKAQ
jgi:DNA invertase Pin-like site-specific DNA recombinase